MTNVLGASAAHRFTIYFHALQGRLSELPMDHAWLIHQAVAAPT